MDVCFQTEGAVKALTKAKEIGGSVRVLQKPKYGKRNDSSIKSTENEASSSATNSQLNDNLDSFPDEEFLGSISGLIQVIKQTFPYKCFCLSIECCVGRNIITLPVQSGKSWWKKTLFCIKMCVFSVKKWKSIRTRRCKTEELF